VEIVEKKIADLIQAEYNPRQLNSEQYEQIKSSLLRFGCVDPVLVNVHEDRKNVIIGGHQRSKVWKDLGNDTIPCVELSLDLDKEKELNVRLNKNTGEFDFDMLAEHFEQDDLLDWGFDESEFEFELDDSNDNDEDSEYTNKIEAPVYEITGEKPELSELVNNEKVNELAKKIEGATIPDEIREFLLYASQRHRVFDYGKIAEFYAHSEKDTQELMEDSALVIIDFDKALENGYVRMSEEVARLYGEEYPDA